MNALELDLVKTVAIITNLVLTISVLFYTHAKEKDKATKSSIDRVERNLEARIEATNDRVNNLEKEVVQLPSNDEIVRLHERMDKLISSLMETNMLLHEMSGEIKHLTRVHHER